MSTPAGTHERVSLHRVTDALDARECRPRARGDHLDARCPAHEDKRASLTVDWRDGATYVRCHAGCDNAAVLAALGLALADLYDVPMTRGATRTARPTSTPRKRATTRTTTVPRDVRAYDTARAFPHDAGDKLPVPARTAVRAIARRATATYDYCDEHGTLLGTRVRGPRKRFSWRDADGAAHAPARRTLYRLPEVLAARDSGARVWLVEGEKDVEALVACGVTATTPGSVTDAWRDEHTAALRGAHVVIVADDDAPGYKRAAQLLDTLRDVAASVAVVRAAEGKDSTDHLAAGHGLRAFVPVAARVLHNALTPRTDARTDDAAHAHADEARAAAAPDAAAPVPAQRADDAHADNVVELHPNRGGGGGDDGSGGERKRLAHVQRDAYALHGDGLVKVSADKDGATKLREVLNVRAQLVRKVRRDMCDGAEPRVTHYDLRCEREGQAHELHVTRDEWKSLDWTDELPWPVQYGRNSAGKSDVLNAITMTSGAVPLDTAYGVLGWREVAGEWLYLHAGGALGAAGETSLRVDVATQLAPYRLPAPPADVEQLREALAASLSLRDVVPARVAAPLLGATFRALLGHTPAPLYLRGGHGTGKTGVAAFAVQHYAPRVTHETMPMQAGEDSATLNALEELLYVLGDSLAVADDLAPDRSASSSGTRANLLARKQYNAVGKARSTRDGGTRPSHAPRGTLLLTGEDSASATSAESRMVTVQVARGDVDVAQLRAGDTPAQREARAQLVAQLVTYCAPRMADEGMARWRHETRYTLSDALRAQVPTLDPRAADAVADYGVGWQLLADAMLAAGAIDEDGSHELLNWAWSGLLECAHAQRDNMAGRTYPERAVQLLRSLFTAGLAHVADRDTGNVPSTPNRWGWLPVSDAGSGEFGGTTLRPSGPRLGWVDGQDVLLDRGAAHAAIVRQADAQGEPLTLTPRALGQALADAGYLVGTDGKNVVQVRVGGKRESVLRLPVWRVYDDDEDDAPTEPPTPPPPPPPAEPSTPPEPAPAPGLPLDAEHLADEPAAPPAPPAPPAPAPAQRAPEPVEQEPAPVRSSERFTAPAVVIDGDGTVWLAGMAGAVRAEGVPELENLPELLRWAERARLGIGYRHAYADAGQVWLTASATKRYGLPAAPPEKGSPLALPALKACAADGWELSSATGGSWLNAYRRGGRGLWIVPAEWQHAVAADVLHVAGQDARTVAERVGLYVAHVGIPLRVSPAATGLDLLRNVRSNPKSRKLSGPVEPCPPASLGNCESPYAAWSRKPTSDERAQEFVHLIDVNGQHLAAASRLLLGAGQAQHVTGAPAFDKRRPGYWKVKPPTSPADVLLPDLLDPSGTRRGGALWVTTPTLAAALEFGYELEPSEAWLYEASSATAFLDPWYERLRDARTQLLAAREDSADAAAVYDALKATYTHGLGLLASPTQAGRDLHRPDWWHAVVAEARAKLTRKMRDEGERSGRFPLAIATDALLYASDEPDPVAACPSVFRIGTGLGQVKVLGTARMAGVAQLLDAGASVSDVLAHVKGGA